jgi:hypothetical protein
MFALSREMANSSSIRSRTDTKGRYISQGLQPGVYRVSLGCNGAVKAAIGNTKTKSDQATQLNFDLKPVAAGQGKRRAKERKAHGLDARRRPAVIRAVAGSKFPTGAAEPGALNVKKSERGRFAAPSSEHGFDLRRALRPRGEFFLERERRFLMRGKIAGRPAKDRDSTMPKRLKTAL